MWARTFWALTNSYAVETGRPAKTHRFRPDPLSLLQVSCTYYRVAITPDYLVTVRGSGWRKAVGSARTHGAGTGIDCPQACLRRAVDLCWRLRKQVDGVDRSALRLRHREDAAACAFIGARAAQNGNPLDRLTTGVDEGRFGQRARRQHERAGALQRRILAPGQRAPRYPSRLTPPATNRSHQAMKRQVRRGPATTELSLSLT